MTWELVVDCFDPDRLAEFWCVALHYQPLGSVGQYRSIAPADRRSGPKVIFQKVPDGKVVKNRLHLDVHAGDVENEAMRLMKAGATRVRSEQVQEFGIAWILMQDPEGNEFCVVPRS